MSQKRHRGGRAGKRVQRGRVGSDAHEERESLAEYKRLHEEAHAIYERQFLEASGLRCLPEDQGWGFCIPLPNDWLLELTDGNDGGLFPPGHQEGNGVIFWLITPDGLYAAEDDLVFNAKPELIPKMVVAYANRLLWRRRGEIVGEIPAAMRKGLPRIEAQKLKVLVERGVFVQPTMEGVGLDPAVA